ncbi:hypothetical protein V8G54_026420, partial [Vigna mungo]
RIDVGGILPIEDIAISSGVEDHLSDAEKSPLKEGNSEGTEECNSVNTSNSEPKSSKSAKRNKWKHDDVKKLIGMPGELNDRFQVGKEGWPPEKKYLRMCCLMGSAEVLGSVNLCGHLWYRNTRFVSSNE